MRYRFLDDVVSLDLGPRPSIEVVKTFPAEDDAFSGPGGAGRVPSSLVLELLAMTGGYLVFRHLSRRRLPLLLKVEECCFEASGDAGTRLTAHAELDGVSSDLGGALVAQAHGRVSTAGRPLAAARLLYVCVDAPGHDLGAYEGGGGG